MTNWSTKTAGFSLTKKLYRDAIHRQKHENQYNARNVIPGSSMRAGIDAQIPANRIPTLLDHAQKLLPQVHFAEVAARPTSLLQTSGAITACQ